MGTAKPTNYNDLRVRKTERAIRDAFYQLVKEKNVNKITIRELVEIAEINKTTFYAHYETIQDLIETLERESIDQIVSNMDSIHLLFDDPDSFINNMYHTLCHMETTNITQSNSSSAHFMEQLSVRLTDEAQSRGVDVNRYRSIGALLSFVLNGLLSLVENRSDSSLDDLEYIKAFVRGGVLELQRL